MISKVWDVYRTTHGSGGDPYVQIMYAGKEGNFAIECAPDEVLELIQLLTEQLL